jgi:hypothetical protein
MGLAFGQLRVARCYPWCDEVGFRFSTYSAILSLTNVYEVDFIQILNSFAIND